MTHLTYFGVMLACVLGTLPLEYFYRARVWRRFRRTALSVLPVAAVFVTWDYLAAAAGWWHFDPAFLTGWWVGGLPVEELVFFLVIPVCGILTLEGVRHVKPHWGIAADLPLHPDDESDDESDAESDDDDDDADADAASESDNDARRAVPSAPHRIRRSGE